MSAIDIFRVVFDFVSEKSNVFIGWSGGFGFYSIFDTCGSFTHKES